MGEEDRPWLRVIRRVEVPRPAPLEPRSLRVSGIALFGRAITLWAIATPDSPRASRTLPGGKR